MAQPRSRGHPASDWPPGADGPQPSARPMPPAARAAQQGGFTVAEHHQHPAAAPRRHAAQSIAEWQSTLPLGTWNAAGGHPGQHAPQPLLHHPHLQPAGLLSGGQLQAHPYRRTGSGVASVASSGGYRSGGSSQSNATQSSAARSGMAPQPQWAADLGGGGPWTGTRQPPTMAQPQRADPQQQPPAIRRVQRAGGQSPEPSVRPVPGARQRTPAVQQQQHCIGTAADGTAWAQQQPQQRSAAMTAAAARHADPLLMAAPPRASASGDSSDGSSARPRSSAAPVLSAQETDEHRIAQRRKQLHFGKATSGYGHYRRAVPTWLRQPGNSRHPLTPDAGVAVSKRRWDHLVGEWRRALHAWDDDPAPDAMSEPGAATSADMLLERPQPLAEYLARTAAELAAVQEFVLEVDHRAKERAAGGGGGSAGAATPRPKHADSESSSAVTTPQMRPRAGSDAAQMTPPPWHALGGRGSTCSGSVAATRGGVSVKSSPGALSAEDDDDQQALQQTVAAAVRAATALGGTGPPPPPQQQRPQLNVAELRAWGCAADDAAAPSSQPDDDAAYQRTPARPKPRHGAGQHVTLRIHPTVAPEDSAARLGDSPKSAGMRTPQVVDVTFPRDATPAAVAENLAHYCKVNPELLELCDSSSAHHGVAILAAHFGVEAAGSDAELQLVEVRYLGDASKCPLFTARRQAGPLLQRDTTTGQQQQPSSSGRDEISRELAAASPGAALDGVLSGLSFDPAAVGSFDTPSHAAYGARLAFTPTAIGASSTLSLFYAQASTTPHNATLADSSDRQTVSPQLPRRSPQAIFSFIGAQPTGVATGVAGGAAPSSMHAMLRLSPSPLQRMHALSPSPHGGGAEPAAPFSATKQQHNDLSMSLDEKFAADERDDRRAARE